MNRLSERINQFFEDRKDEKFRKIINERIAKMSLGMGDKWYSVRYINHYGLFLIYATKDDVTLYELICNSFDAKEFLHSNINEYNVLELVTSEEIIEDLKVLIHTDMTTYLASYKINGYKGSMYHYNEILKGVV